MAMPLARSADRRYYGVAPALVTDNADPAKQGRVKLKLPWFDGSTELPWTRVAQLYAGGGYGSLWVPEVGDEVVVAFTHGDMRFPVVLGGMYNGVDKPSSFRDATKDQKLFRTKAGHQVLLEDSPGAEKVVVESKGGHKITLDDVTREVKVECASGQSIHLDPAGAVTIKGTTSVKLDAPAVDVGTGAIHPLVLGDLLLLAFNGHTHNCTAPGTPSGPPVPLMADSVLSKVNKTA
jgi:uncharacterized protein involved in type VI secretion and phage assembly